MREYLKSVTVLPQRACLSGQGVTPGTYAEYGQWQDNRDKIAKKTGQQEVVAVESAPKPEPNQRSAQAEPEPANSASPDQKKALRELADMEVKIDALEKELARYEKQLADPQIYQNTAQLKDATTKFEQVKKELAQLNDRWEILAET